MSLLIFVSVNSHLVLMFYCYVYVYRRWIKLYSILLLYILHTRLGIHPGDENTYISEARARESGGSMMKASQNMRNLMGLIYRDRLMNIYSEMWSAECDGCEVILKCTMVYRWLYTYSPIFCIEFVSKLSRQSVSPSTDHKFASSLSVSCHDGRFHRKPTISSTYGR